MVLSGFTVIKNGVALGYPFVESILSLLPACDEFVISEGYSDDDTFYWLTRLQKKFPDKIRLRRDRWPTGRRGGGVIGDMQSRILRRCQGRWAYLLQADEIMPPENLDYLRGLCEPRNLAERIVGRRRFNSYALDFAHVVDNFQRLDIEPGYRWAIRLVRNRRGITPLSVKSGGDGWQMEGPGCSLIGVARLPRPIWHIGYNFPVNIWRKWINHAPLYPNLPDYQQRAREARENLDAWQAGQASLPTENPLGLPALIAPLIGQSEYFVREDLFQ